VDDEVGPATGLDGPHDLPPRPTASAPRTVSSSRRRGRRTRSDRRVSGQARETARPPAASTSRRRSRCRTPAHPPAPPHQLGVAPAPSRPGRGAGRPTGRRRPRAGAEEASTSRRRGGRRGRRARAVRARRGRRGGRGTPARAGQVGGDVGDRRRRWNVSPVPRARASALAPATSSSDIRSCPTRVTQPVTRPPAGNASSTAAWRSSTSGAGAANGPSSTSQPHVPTVPRMPTVVMPAATRAGWATVPASIVVVTPWVTASTQARVAESSSSSPVCGGVHGHGPGEDRLAGGEVVGDRRADQAIAGQVLVGVDEARGDDRARPAEGRHAEVAPGRLCAVDHPEDRPVGHEDGGVDEDRARPVHREHVVAGHDEVGGRDRGRVRGRWQVGGHRGARMVRRSDHGRAQLIFARVSDRAALRPPGPAAALVRRRPQRRPGPRAGRRHAARPRLRRLAGRRRRRRRRATAAPTGRRRCRSGGWSRATWSARTTGGASAAAVAACSCRPPPTGCRRRPRPTSGPSMPPSATASSGSAPVSRRPASRRSATTPTRAIAGSTWMWNAGRPRPPG
jgi:hypothetical protein